MTRELGTDVVIADRYRVADRVGGGAMADVYAATDERFHRQVAVKIFRAGADDQPRFERESKTLINVQHPNIIGVLDAGEHDGLPFVVLDLYDYDLGDLFEDGSLPDARVAAIGCGVAKGLAAAHDAGVVHRDVKPSNILVSEEGHVVLADFGVARLVDQTRMTATAATIGTPAYLAPEQAAGEPVGPSADVYALGLVLIEALSGVRPFPGSHQESLAARLLRTPDLPEGVSQPWQRLLEAMTQRDPDARPSAAAVARALEDMGSDDATAMLSTAISDAPATVAMAPVTAAARRQAPARPPGQSGSWVPIAAAILIAAILLGAIALALSGDDDPTPPPATETTTTVPAPTTAVTRAPAVATTDPPTTDAPEVTEVPTTEATPEPTTPPATDAPVIEEETTDDSAPE